MPEASRETLIRRVTLDLTGLTPTLAEVDAFVQDADPKAYDKLVDRVLQSPHYGERMALEWLDASRFADTNGYHIDNGRDMTRWRNWVINSFNRNLPFDQFTIQHLQRLIVTSATYHQHSQADPALTAKDPENRLLAHGPRHRLPAEFILNMDETVTKG